MGAHAGGDFAAYLLISPYALNHPELAEFPFAPHVHEAKAAGADPGRRKLRAHQTLRRIASDHGGSDCSKLLTRIMTRHSLEGTEWAPTCCLKERAI